jgi:hypothetical protein
MHNQNLLIGRQQQCLDRKLQAVSEMDGAKFSKLFKDTKAFTKTFTPTDADLIFAKVCTSQKAMSSFLAVPYSCDDASEANTRSPLGAPGTTTSYRCSACRKVNHLSCGQRHEMRHRMVAQVSW